MSKEIKRPVWYVGKHAAESYDTVEEGQKVHGRPPDAIGVYTRDEDGFLEWIRDESPGSRYLNPRTHGARQRNPLQAGGRRFVLVAREKRRHHPAELVYDGVNFRKPGPRVKPHTFPTRLHAFGTARTLERKYPEALKGFDLVVK